MASFDGIQAPSYPVSAPNYAQTYGAHKEEPEFLDRFEKLAGDSNRKGFVGKVFGILLAQMIVTTIFCAFCYTNEPIRQFIVDSPVLYLFAAIVSLILALTLACVKSIARAVPTNYILLFCFTICESYCVATISAFYEPQSVLLAALLTLVLFGILTYYGFTHKGDLQYWGPIMSVAMGVGLVTCIMMIFFRNQIMFLICCWIGLILTCIYTIYDVYLITEKYGLDEDDYIIGAMLLYLDIINLFIYILSILGDRRN